MTWYTTKVERLGDLAVELNRLQTAGHDIFKVVSKDGSLVIISSTTP